MAEVKEIGVSTRGQLAALLDTGSAADALAAYYALEHPQEKVQLYGFVPFDGAPRGFLATAQTGGDLFRPLVVPFVAHPDGLQALLRAALRPGRPVILHLPVEQRAWAEEVVELTDQTVVELLRLDPQAYEPIMNVFVVEARTPEGLPRYEIRSQDSLQAAAGVNWNGKRFAEVYLNVGPEARGRGFGKSVLAAITGRLLGERKIALYRVQDGDVVSRTEAFRLGFRPAGHRSLIAQAVLRSTDRDDAQP